MFIKLTRDHTHSEYMNRPIYIESANIASIFTYMIGEVEATCITMVGGTTVHVKETPEEIFKKLNGGWTITDGNLLKWEE